MRIASCDCAFCLILSPHIHTAVFNVLASLGMDGIFHKTGKVGVHYGCVSSAISKIWPARIRSLAVMGNEVATLYSAFSIYIQTLHSYLLLMSLHEYVQLKSGILCLFIIIIYIYWLALLY